jgi:hypothetical protein
MCMSPSQRPEIVFTIITSNPFPLSTKTEHNEHDIMNVQLENVDQLSSSTLFIVYCSAQNII